MHDTTEVRIKMTAGPEMRDPKVTVGEFVRERSPCYSVGYKCFISDGMYEEIIIIQIASLRRNEALLHRYICFYGSGNTPSPSYSHTIWKSGIGEINPPVP